MATGYHSMHEHAFAPQKGGAVVPHSVVLLIIACCFMTYFSWSCVLPQSQSPDEMVRYLVPSFIVENGYLPDGGDPAIRHDFVGASYGYTIYGSTLIAVPFMLIARAFGADAAGTLVAARFASVLFATGTVALCFPLGRRLFKRPSTVVLFAVLVGFLPQFVFLGSYFNSDTIEVFATAFVLLALMRGSENGWRIRDCMVLGVSLAVCAYSYYFAYGAILISIVVYYVTASPLRRRAEQSAAEGARSGLWEKNSTFRLFVGNPLIVFFTAFALAGWFFVRNFILYDGDIFGMSAMSQASELYAIDEWKPSNRPTLHNQGIGFGQLLPFCSAYADNWYGTTIRSFVCCLGYMSIPLGAKGYFAYYLIILVGGIAGMVEFSRCRSARFFGAVLLALMIIPLVVSLYYTWAVDWQSQGRYLMAGMIPAMMFVAKGWESLANRFENRAFRMPRVIASTANDLNVCQKHAGSLFIVAVIACWMLLFAYVAYTLIIPLCTGGPLS